jgi:hypothetical protein
MINPASFARAILTTKSVNVETCREMGRAHRYGPWDPERSRKMREALSVLNAMSAEARRYYRAERRSRWLTNCIVTHPDRKVFDLAGVDPLTGRRFWVHIEMAPDASLLDFLLLVMNCPDAPMTMRLDAAKTAAPLMHERPKPVVTLEQRRERKRQYMRKRYRERLSAVVATDEANPPVAER